MLSLTVLCENLSIDLLLPSHVSLLYRCHMTTVPKLENTDPSRHIRGGQGTVSVLSIWRPSEELKTCFTVKINHGYAMDRQETARPESGTVLGRNAGSGANHELRFQSFFVKGSKAYSSFQATTHHTLHLQVHKNKQQTKRPQTGFSLSLAVETFYLNRP